MSWVFVGAGPYVCFAAAMKMESEKEIKKRADCHQNIVENRDSTEKHGVYTNEQHKYQG